MRKLIILAIAMLVLLQISTVAFAQKEGGKILRSDIPIGSRGWMFGINGTVPLFKIIEAEPSSGASMDVSPMVGVGGGLTIYYGKKDDPENEKIISINVPTLAMSMRETDEKKMDLTLIADVGFFDNRIRFGAGYEFGKLAYSRSRIVGVFSIGVTF